LTVLQLYRLLALLTVGSVLQLLLLSSDRAGCDRGRAGRGLKPARLPLLLLRLHLHPRTAHAAATTANGSAAANSGADDRQRRRGGRGVQQHRQARRRGGGRGRDLARAASTASHTAHRHALQRLHAA
jgi:hypothetical protein